MIRKWLCKHGHLQYGGDPEDGCVCEQLNSAPQVAGQISGGWTRFIKLLRKPEDKGVGDTVARMIASVGLDRWKAFSKKIGIPCGCSQRQDELNRLWPYESQFDIENQFD